MDTFAVSCVGMRHVDPTYIFSEDHVYAFIPENNNPHDENAVLVVRADQDNRPVGHIAREFAPHLRRIMTAGELHTIRYDKSTSSTFKKTFQIEYVSPATKKMLDAQRVGVKRVRFSVVEPQEVILIERKTRPTETTTAGDFEQQVSPPTPPRRSSPEPRVS